MFIAMNHFQVIPEREAEFEQIWKQRESFLREVPGFVEFALLRGDVEGEYISHSVWQTREAFMGWTQSEAFVKGHRQGASLQGIVAGPPALTTFQVVIRETPSEREMDDSLPAAGRTGIMH